MITRVAVLRRWAGSRSARRIAAACAALAIAGFATGSPPANATAGDAGVATVSPDVVLQAYEQAIGGRAAWKPLRSLRITLELTVKGLGIQGAAEVLVKPPAKMIATMDIPGIGKLRTASNGKQQWSEDPINGLRVLTGAEAEQVRIESAWNAELNLRSLYARINPHRADAQGHACLELVPRTAKPVVRCFDSATHLLISETGSQMSPQGETPLTRRFRDYRGIDGAPGVLVPWVTELEAGPMTIELKIKRIVPNTAIPDAEFALPKKPR